METQNQRAVDVELTRAKRIYISIIKVNKLFSFLSSRCFLKEIENMYSVFLSSYADVDWVCKLGHVAMCGQKIENQKRQQFIPAVIKI